MLPSLLHPEWLGDVAALWVALVGATLVALVRARRRGRRLFAGGVRPAGAGGDALLLLALLAVGVALLGPRIGTRLEHRSSSGVDVAVLVDVSRSMDARDLPPSRLDRARQVAATLLAGLEPGDRAALAAFAGEGVLLTPLTHDHVALADLLPALDTDLVHPASSRLGAGVRSAIEAFDPASERPRVLVLLSDGEDADRQPDSARAELERANVRVIAVPLGTAEGGTIPRLGLELRDRNGRIVTTRVDASRLARLAEATGGSLLRPGPLGAVDAAALRAEVRRDAPSKAHGDAPSEGAEGVVLEVPAVRVVPFALAALVLLLLEAGAGARRVAPVAATAVLAMLAVGAAGDESRAPLASDARALLSRGLALAEQARWAEAERAFQAAALAAREPEIAADAYHDAGVAALAAGRLEAARDAFLESLAAAPTFETRFNLEWTLRALETPPPPPAGTAQPSDEEHGDPGEAPVEPQPAPEAPPAPQPEMQRPQPASRPEAPPPLSTEEAERWLARANDDPALALRGHRDERSAPERGSAW